MAFKKAVFLSSALSLTWLIPTANAQTAQDYRAYYNRLPTVEMHLEVLEKFRPQPLRPVPVTPAISGWGTTQVPVPQDTILDPSLPKPYKKPVAPPKPKQTIIRKPKPVKVTKPALPKVETPKKVEAPKKVKTPKKVEAPKKVEIPKKVEVIPAPPKGAVSVPDIDTLVPKIPSIDEPTVDAPALTPPAAPTLEIEPTLTVPEIEVPDTSYVPIPGKTVSDPDQPVIAKGNQGEVSSSVKTSNKLPAIALPNADGGLNIEVPSPDNDFVPPIAPPSAKKTDDKPSIKVPSKEQAEAESSWIPSWVPFFGADEEEVAAPVTKTIKKPEEPKLPTLPSKDNGLPAELPPITAPGIEEPTSPSLELPKIETLPELEKVPQASKITPGKVETSLPEISLPGAELDIPALPTFDDSDSKPEIKPAKPTAEVASVVKKPVDLPTNMSIQFGKASTVISKENESKVESIAQQIASDTAQRVKLISYANGTGQSDSHTRRISLQRAIEVRNIFIKHGVERTRVNVQVMGEDLHNPESDRVDIIMLQGAGG